MLPFPQALLGAARMDLPPDGKQPQRIGGIPVDDPFAPASVEGEYLQASSIGTCSRSGHRQGRCG